MTVLEFLNQNSGAFAVIFSAVVAVATVMYAILTWRLTSETRKMREVQTEPKVSVIVQPKEEWINFIDMVIQNIGLGPAYNIKFKINPDFEYAKGKFLSELGFMKNGLRYLAPSQKLQFFLTSMIENFEEKTKKTFEIRVTYQNNVGKKYEDVYIIDFSQLIGLSQLGEPPLYKIAKNIEKIQRNIQHLSTGFHKMKVIRYTKEDIEEEQRQRLEQKSQKDDGR
ncbi:MAG: hypothetical protein PWP37_1078 [Thermotogota bacterium]|nr:hypothetical protein [Thermotogota bacterium]